MKILQINYGLGRGGAETLIVDLSNQLVKDPQNEVVFVSVYDKSIDKFFKIKDFSSKIRWVSVGAKTGLSIKSLLGVYSVIKNEKPDVVHLHSSIMLLLLPAILYRKVKYVHTLHSSAERCLVGKFVKAVGKFLYSNGFVQPVTISEDSHLSYIKYLGLNNDVCIPNGIASIKATDKYLQTQQELLSLGINSHSDVPLIIHVARHHPVKNHERLFSSFVRLEKEGIPFQLIVVGDKYEAYEPIYKDNKYIHLLGPKDNVADYLLQADYFVLTSDMEGLPITLLEAMSAGVVPICTPAGGINNVIINGVNGYKSEKVDDESYYQTLKRVLVEKGKVKKDSVKEDYRKKYSIEYCERKYYKLYLNYSNSL